MSFKKKFYDVLKREMVYKVYQEYIEDCCNLINLFFERQNKRVNVFNDDCFAEIIEDQVFDYPECKFKQVYICDSTGNKFRLDTFFGLKDYFNEHDTVFHLSSIGYDGLFATLKVNIFSDISDESSHKNVIANIESGEGLSYLEIINNCLEDYVKLKRRLCINSIYDYYLERDTENIFHSWSGVNFGDLYIPRISNHYNYYGTCLSISLFLIIYSLVIFHDRFINDTSVNKIVDFKEDDSEIVDFNNLFVELISQNNIGVYSFDERLSLMKNVSKIIELYIDARDGYKCEYNELLTYNDSLSNMIRKASLISYSSLPQSIVMLQFLKTKISLSSSPYERFNDILHEDWTLIKCIVNLSRSCFKNSLSGPIIDVSVLVTEEDENDW